MILAWGVQRLHWENGQLVYKWSRPADWQPAPALIGLWEPAFQPVMANGFIYAPDAGGTRRRASR